jgi:hypothetical protein
MRCARRIKKNQNRKPRRTRSNTRHDFSVFASWTFASFVKFPAVEFPGALVFQGPDLSGQDKKSLTAEKREAIPQGGEDPEVIIRDATLRIAVWQYWRG